MNRLNWFRLNSKNDDGMAMGEGNWSFAETHTTNLLLTIPPPSLPPTGFHLFLKMESSHPFSELNLFSAWFLFSFSLSLFCDRKILLPYKLADAIAIEIQSDRVRPRTPYAYALCTIGKPCLHFDKEWKKNYSSTVHV